MMEAGDSCERVVAGVASIVLTVSIGALFLRPLEFRQAPSSTDEIINVIFIDPPPASRPSGLRRAAKSPPSVARRRRDSGARAIRGTDGPASAAPAPTTTGAALLDDAWTLPEPVYRFRSSTDRLVGKAPRRLEAHVDRLHVRMKDPITVEAVLREVGKSLGLWPPGYTDDPCPGIDRLADYYRAHPEQSGSDLMQQTLDLESRCKRTSPTSS